MNTNTVLISHNPEMFINLQYEAVIRMEHNTPFLSGVNIMLDGKRIEKIALENNQVYFDKSTAERAAINFLIDRLTSSKKNNQKPQKASQTEKTEAANDLMNLFNI